LLSVYLAGGEPGINGGAMARLLVLVRGNADDGFETVLMADVMT
jgi:hypothetical protein